MLKLPGRAYSALARILDLPGSEGLRGLQEEIVAVQDLSRVLMADKVKHTYYTLTTTPGATAGLTITWADASDWTEVLVNGIITVIDADLPQPSDDRWITYVGLEVGVGANYTAGMISRVGIDTTTTTTLVQLFGAIITSGNGPLITPPYILPLKLARGEIDARFNQVISGAGPVFNYVVEVVSAEPGVLSAVVGG